MPNIGVGKQSLVERTFGAMVPASTSQVRMPTAPGGAGPHVAPTDRAAGAATNLVELEAALGAGEAPDGHEARLARSVGADPATMRLHRGPAATQAAAQRGALAFTVGSHVVLGGSVPASATPEGEEVLLHEAAHVAQQQDAARDPDRRTQPIGDEASGAERDADQATALGGPVTRTGLQVQRWPLPQQTPKDIGARSIAGKASFIKKSMVEADTGWARAVVDTFEQTEPTERLVLQRQLDMATLVAAMPDFEATRLGTLGPLVAGQAHLNRKRAAYIEQVINDFGPQGEVFVLFAFRGVYDDDAYAIFEQLANHRYLHKLLAMPEVRQQIEARGLKTEGFQEPEVGLVGAAREVFEGIGTGLHHAVKDDRPGKYGWQKSQLPPEYQLALRQIDNDQLIGSLTAGNVALGAFDQVTFGVPHGVVQLGQGLVEAIRDIARGEYRAAGENLTGAAVVLLTHLGIKAWRVIKATRPSQPEPAPGTKPVDDTPGLKGPEGPGQFVLPNFQGPITAQEARLGAIFELNPEAQAAMGRLIARIGRDGVEKVAGLVQADSRAALLVAEQGELGVYALLEAEGNAAIAATKLPVRQLGIGSQPHESRANGHAGHAKPSRARDAPDWAGDLKREPLRTPNGRTVEIIAQGRAVIPTGKVEAYLRGGVKPFGPELKAELRHLQEFKQRSRKEFDENSQNQARIDELKKLKHNADRSRAMAVSLDDAGIANTAEYNAALFRHLLEVGQKVVPGHRLDVASEFAGPSSNVKILTTWKILPDGRAYLSTIKIIPGGEP